MDDDYIFNPAPDDYKKFFTYIIFGFITAVVSGVWVWLVMNLQGNAYFSNSVAAAIIVGMITTSVTVIFVVFSSALFRGYMKEKMVYRRLEKEQIRNERLKELARRQVAVFGNMGQNIQQSANNVVQQVVPEKKEKQEDKSLGDMTLGSGWNGGGVK